MKPLADQIRLRDLLAALRPGQAFTVPVWAREAILGCRRSDLDLKAIDFDLEEDGSVVVRSRLWRLPEPTKRKARRRGSTVFTPKSAPVPPPPPPPAPTAPAAPAARRKAGRPRRGVCRFCGATDQGWANEAQTACSSCAPLLNAPRPPRPNRVRRAPKAAPPPPPPPPPPAPEPEPAPEVVAELPPPPAPLALGNAIAKPKPEPLRKLWTPGAKEKRVPRASPAFEAAPVEPRALRASADAGLPPTPLAPPGRLKPPPVDPRMVDAARGGRV